MTSAEAYGLKLGNTISSWVSRNGLKAGLIAAGIVGTVSLMDMMVRGDNLARSNEMESKQRRDLNREVRRRNDSKILKEAYNYQLKYKTKEEDMVLPNYVGLTQELFSRRTGHSNTWGGKKY